MIGVLYAVPALAQCLDSKLTALDWTPGDNFGWSVAADGDRTVVGANRGECAGGTICGAAYVFRADGGSWIAEQRLTASDGESYDKFGESVSISGDTIVVGVPFDGGGLFTGRGSAYVYRFNGIAWEQAQKLTAPDGGSNDQFGHSVSVSENTAVVGALRGACAAGDRLCGSAYVFRFDGTNWVEEQKLTASDGGRSDRFGASVSVSGETILVGADAAGCYRPVAGCGAAYVFRFDGNSWVEEQKLSISGGSSSSGYPQAVYNSGFGLSVSLSGDIAVVGAPRAGRPQCDDCGAAYVYRFDGTSWILDRRLTAIDSGEGDDFGRAVAVNGTTAVVGAPHHRCTVGSNCGAAYMFWFGHPSWVVQEKLSGFVVRTGDILGLSVSMSGNRTAVGAPWSDCAEGEGCGAAFVQSCPDPAVLSLDIKPGSCPNRVNLRSQGVVPVAIVGTWHFDVAMVDADSLTLARADGVGGSVSPLSGSLRRRGYGIVIEDVATPFDGEPCACHALGGDGIDDLSLKFSMSDMSREFQLNASRGRGSIKLVLRGSLQDGTTFEGFDCIVLTRRARFLRR